MRAQLEPCKGIISYEISVMVTARSMEITGTVLSKYSFSPSTAYENLRFLVKV
jgi:hypothetical protein